MGQVQILLQSNGRVTWDLAFLPFAFAFIYLSAEPPLSCLFLLCSSPFLQADQLFQPERGAFYLPHGGLAVCTVAIEV